MLQMSYADWMATGSNLKFPKNTANRELPKNSSSQKRVDAVSFSFVKLITNQWNVKFRKKNSFIWILLQKLIGL